MNCGDNEQCWNKKKYQGKKYKTGAEQKLEAESGAIGVGSSAYRLHPSCALRR